MDISVIIPIFNEQAIIEELYERLTINVKKFANSYELIFVNDGSRDNSLAKLIEIANRDKNVKYINFSRNFGHQIAVTAGLDNAKGQAIVIIDGDLQDPPELIPALYSKYKEGYECVYAKRATRKGETFFKKFTAKMFYRTLKAMTEVDIPLDTGDYRLIDRKLVEGLKAMPEKNKFLRGQIAWLGFRQTFVEYNRDERKAGVTGYSLKKMLRLAMDGITAFSDMPLSFVTNIGVLFSFFSFLVIVYALFSHFILQQTVTGWTSLIISTMFIGSVQLVAIGIIGEYLKRINANVRNRPLYVIEKDNLKD